MTWPVIQTSFLIVLCLLPFWFAYRMLVNKKRKTSMRYELKLFTFFSYLVSVATATIIPLSATSRNPFPSGHVNVLPVYMTIYKFFKYQSPLYPIERHMLYFNFVGNILLFMPFGFLLPMLSEKSISARKIILLSLLTSMFIELCQFVGLSFHIYRFVDIDDVILNVLGAVMGFWMYRIFIRFYTPK